MLFLSHRPSVLAIIFDFLRFLRPAARAAPAAPADSGEPGKPGELEVKRPSAGAGACGCECEETHLAIVHLPRQAGRQALGHHPYPPSMCVIASDVRVMR